MEQGKVYSTFTDVILHYRKYIEKLFSDDIYREDTYVSYLSYLRILQDWNDSRKIPATYIYQFDETMCSDFLEYVYVSRENTARTRDNYLGWLKSFSSFLIQHRYIKTNPTEGLKTLSKSAKKKQRKILSERDILKLQEYF
jgi:site-specific recombinase XerD